MAARGGEFGLLGLVHGAWHGAGFGEIKQTTIVVVVIRIRIHQDKTYRVHRGGLGLDIDNKLD